MTLLRSTAPLCLLALLLTGCAGQPQRPITKNIDQIDHWQINGKVGLRSPSDNGSALLTWQQQGLVFDITLSGPFGAGSVRLAGTPEQLTLEQDGQARTLSLAEAEDALQLPLPVGDLHYWIRGLPNPGAEARPGAVNGQGRLRYFEQNQWRIDYLAYTESRGVTLPAKLLLSRDKTRITIVIKEWLL